MKLPHLLAAGSALALGASLHAATLQVNEPVVGTTQYGLVATGTNDDPGAEYATATYESFALLAQQIFDLGVHSYASVQELMEETFNFGLGGNANTGWSIAIQSDGKIITSNNGIVPGVTYVQFLTGVTQSVFVTADTANLELNSTPGHQPFSLALVNDPAWNPDDFDAIIVKADHPLLLAPNYSGNTTHHQSAGFTGHEDAFNSYTAQAPTYVMLDPRDFARHPKVTAFNRSAGMVAIDLDQLDPTLTYAVWRSTNLANWSQIDTFSPTQATHSWSQTNNDPRAFYRVDFAD